MIRRLNQECFNKLWKIISQLYPTQDLIKTFMVKSSFSLQKVELLGTGENMVYSLLSLADAGNRIPDIVNTALQPGEYPDHEGLRDILNAMNDHSAFVPEIVATKTALFNDADETVKVFLAYDINDDQLVNELRKQLSPLVRFSRSIEVFDMHHDISGGANQKDMINEQLEEAQIVLLSITPDFIGNDKNDCDRIMFNAQKMGKRVIPVLLEPCMWDRIAVLEDIVPLPKNKKYVSLWSNKNEAWLKVVKGIKCVADTIKGKPCEADD